MPETKLQKLIFGILMSVTMAYGMEVYNVAIAHGYAAMPGGFTNIQGSVFLDALVEMSYMWILVFIFSNLVGLRAGHALAAKVLQGGKESPFVQGLAFSGCTVLVMCPIMSAVAAILFSIIRGGAPASEFLTLWLGTLMKNFPMAILWNIFAAGPASRWIFKNCCVKAPKTEVQNG